MESVATTTEVHAGELAARWHAKSRIAGNLRNHRILCVGVLYVITIIVVLAFVTRL
jgi:t-SNARE complex subunit (syntaxin)